MHYGHDCGCDLLVIIITYNHLLLETDATEIPLSSPHQQLGSESVHRTAVDMTVRDVPQELWALCLEWVAISERNTTTGSAQHRMRDLALLCKGWKVRRKCYVVHKSESSY